MYYVLSLNDIDTQLKFCDCSQLNMIAGRTLEVEFAHEDKTGETIFIMVDRRNLLQTALDEASCLHDFRKPLEVQIYNEVKFFSVDFTRSAPAEHISPL